jgi:TetR/AcrR family transcriptional regulator, transcriptional repressor for nem operon
VGKRDYEAFSADRLQAAAAILFYTKGYAVGLNDILESAGIYKATFYKYYGSKDALAAEYITHKQEELVTMLGHLMAKRPTPEDFVHSWVKLLAKSARSRDFYGCPFSNLFAQTLQDSPALAAKLKDTVEFIVSYLANYFAKAQQAGLLAADKNPERVALQIFTLYEGAMTMYNLTHEKRVFDRLGKDLQLICFSS